MPLRDSGDLAVIIIASVRLVLIGTLIYFLKLTLLICCTIAAWIVTCELNHSIATIILHIIALIRLQAMVLNRGRNHCLEEVLMSFVRKYFLTRKGWTDRKLVRIDVIIPCSCSSKCKS
jgi:hypothetical protein